MLDQAALSSPSATTSSLSTLIIHKADNIDNTSWMGSPAPGTSYGSHVDSFYLPVSIAGTASNTFAKIHLQQQQLSIPSSFAVPTETSVPVHQLVAVWSHMLGSPELPKDAQARKMEAKWRLLKLLLALAQEDAHSFEAQLHQLLQQVMLPGLDRRLLKVNKGVGGHPARQVRTCWGRV